MPNDGPFNSSENRVEQSVNLGVCLSALGTKEPPAGFSSLADQQLAMIDRRMPI